MCFISQSLILQKSHIFLIMEQRKGLLFVFSGPSGTGKTSVIRGVREKDKNLSFSVSVTTRPQRPGEKEGQDYRFVSKEDFERKIKENAFLEYAEVFGQYYGTLNAEIASMEEKGQDLVFDIDSQGATQLKKKHPHRVVSIFVLPPRLSDLETRLKKRALDHQTVIDHRLQKAVQEIHQWKNYDYAIVNTVLDESIEKAHSIIQSQRLTVLQNSSLICFMDQLLVDSKSSINHT